MEEEWFQERCQDGSQDVKEVILMSVVDVLKLILKELKLLRKDMKK